MALTAKKIRWLHYIGNCGKQPGVHYRNFECYYDIMPDADTFHSMCSNCFPDEQRYRDRNTVRVEEEVGSCSDGSTTDSSEGEAEK